MSIFCTDKKNTKHYKNVSFVFQKKKSYNKMLIMAQTKTQITLRSKYLDTL